MIKKRLYYHVVAVMISSAAGLFISPLWAAGARNVILMISDGAGFNTFHAAGNYQHGRLGGQVYDRPEFVKFGCTHYSLKSDGLPMGYDPGEMWSHPDYCRSASTDSSAAATALNTGIKTTNGRICTDRFGNDLTTFAQIADRYGKSTGAVTTVQISHATPAAVWAHNDSRDNMAAIANEMIYGSGLDVIIGAGNPDFDNNGQSDSATSSYIGGKDTWKALKSNDTGKGWTLIEEKSAFDALAAGTSAPPCRLIGIAQVKKTFQQKRTGSDMAPACPLNTNVPSLATAAKAALHVLSKNQNGFYLMIEGGAVDWSNHDNNIARTIEEQIDFNKAVEAVVEWIETCSSWDETLLIITADHECGMLWGPGLYRYDDANMNGKYDHGVDIFNGFNPIVNNGKGKLPGVEYGYSSHTNALVPLYARGAGCELFAGLVDGTDSRAGTFWDFSGQYVDNTDVFTVMNQAVQKPASLATIGAD